VSGATPRVSLVIPNRNNEPALDLVLGRLAANTTYPDTEVVFVDDESTDDSLAILRRWRDSGRIPNMRLEEIEHSDELGVIKALNRGLELASGEIIVQLDADASVETPGWIEQMLELMLADERVGVVTGRVVIDDGHVHAYGVNIVHPEGMHDRGSTIAEPAGRRTLHSRLERPLDSESPLRDRVAEVDTGMGCCMMYRREDALAVGGYDKGFAPVWFDDLDLGLSIRHSGRKAFFHPGVMVCHRLSMRHTREAAPPRREQLLAQARARVGGMLPPRVRYAAGKLVGVEGPPPAHLERLRHHYAYWREKWGWDFINPDLDAIRDRYGDSELWWAYDPERKAAGEEIIAAYERGRAQASTA